MIIGVEHLSNIDEKNSMEYNKNQESGIGVDYYSPFQHKYPIITESEFETRNPVGPVPGTV